MKKVIKYQLQNGMLFDTELQAKQKEQELLENRIGRLFDDYNKELPDANDIIKNSQKLALVKHFIENLDTFRDCIDLIDFEYDMDDNEN